MLVRSVYLALTLTAFLLIPCDIARADDPFLQRAIELAQASQRDMGVPSSVTLAQAIWETGRGASTIGEANNFFGIKAALNTDGQVNIGPIASGWVWAWTKEWDGTRYVERRERFRKYETMQDSFRDHALLLATNPRYANAMRAVDDPREFARRIADAGYATSPTYARDLIRVMDAENLYQYDLPRNAFELSSQSETRQVNPGEIFQIYFDVKNTGFGTWSPAADYYLASDNPNSFGANTRLELNRLVPPGGTNRWVLTMFAPSDPGSYTTIWRMKHGAQTFGPPMSVQVRVLDSALEFNGWFAVGLAVTGLVGIGALYAISKKSWQKKNPT